MFSASSRTPVGRTAVVYGTALLAICLQLFGLGEAGSSSARVQKSPSEPTDASKRQSAKDCARVQFSGGVIRGQQFKQKLTEDLQFLLVPQDTGWTISVLSPANPAEDFAAISTGPLHGPTPLDIDAVFYRNQDNTGPRNDGSQARMTREFTFVLNHAEFVKVSDAVNLAEYPNNASKKEKEAADAYLGAYARGDGKLTITALHLSPTSKDRQPWIESLEFAADVCVPPAPNSNKKAN